MRLIVAMIALAAISVLPSRADDASASANTSNTNIMTAAVTAPKEVGTTTMTAGAYVLTDQSSGKSYSLTVTDKGDMILGPPAPAAGAAAATAAPATLKTKAESMIKQEAEKGAEKGAMQMYKSGGTKELQGIMK